MRKKPTEEILRKMYSVDRISPEDIGAEFGYSGRTVREWLVQYGIPRLGPAHLRIGKSAVWNVGLVRTDETKEKIRAAKLGSIPHNKGNGRVKFCCAICQNEVFDKPYRKTHTCSKECRNEYMRRLAGEAHWNYKGEDAGFRQRHRNWAAYTNWRKSVMKRDGFRCVSCGAIGVRLTAHHINSFARHVSERFDVQNGATLCWQCHWAFHREYGHKICTKAQFEEWITNSKEQPSSKN